MSSKDTLEAFVSIVKDKIADFSDSSDAPNLNVLKGEVKEKFDELARSQGYVTKEEYGTLELIARRLESRLDELEKKLK